MRIERHVENGRRSTGRGRARTGCESFPIGSSRFVEMNVRIDHAGKDRQFGGVDFRCRGPGEILPERNDLAFADSDVLLAPDEQIEITHSKEGSQIHPYCHPERRRRISDPCLVRHVIRGRK